MKLTRRDLLRLGIVMGGAAMLPGGLRPRTAYAESLPASPPTTPFVWELLPGRGIPPVASPVTDAGILQTIKSSLTRTVPLNTEFYLIQQTPVWHSYHPELKQQSLLWGYGGSIPGVTIVAKSGTPQLIRFANDLPVFDPLGIGEPITAIHRHGGFQAPEDDGYPLDIFSPGRYRDYYFPNHPAGGLQQNEHSTLWYHDHAIDTTAPNVYRGLAGFFPCVNSLDTGDESTGLRLPANFYNGQTVGPFDVGLAIQDRQFGSDGRLVYDTFDHNGFIGDKFCVNGLIQPFLTVQRRKYRFRILNGSNARVYQFFLSTGQPFVVIGTDSNLLPKPITVQSIRLGPGERADVILNFSEFRDGASIFLENRMEQSDGRKPDGLTSRGTPILKFLVQGTTPAFDPSVIPTTLLPIEEGPTQLLPHVKVQRRFEFNRSNGAWQVNGQFFDENRIDAKPKRGEPEIWTFASSGGWVHPIHAHLSEFFVLSRDGKTPPPLEQARKDMVLVGGNISNEVKVLIKFVEFTGRYVFHCHTIEHEDMRMMGNFDVQP